MLGAERTSTPFYPPRIKPSPKPLRFPSNLAKLVNNNLEIVPEQAYENPVVIAPGPPRIAFFTGSEAVRALLLDRQTEFPKGRVQNESLQQLFGMPMISSEGSEWHWQRAAAAPLFRHDELLQYGPIMSGAANATVERWRVASPGIMHRWQL
jgi:cytochrome P450